jgi:hypothetical protein
VRGRGDLCAAQKEDLTIGTIISVLRRSRIGSPKRSFWTEPMSAIFVALN